MCSYRTIDLLTVWRGAIIERCLCIAYRNGAALSLPTTIMSGIKRRITNIQCHLKSL